VLHTTRQEKIFLVGGGGSINTSEIVKDGTQLTLQNSGQASCAVGYKTGFVTIGGDRKVYPHIHGKVDRYDSEGKYLDSLPDLATPRFYHSCTSFLTSNGEQALIVAGGWNGGGYLSSTELFSNGRWKTGGNLPRALMGLRAAHLNQQVVVTGGLDGSNNRDEVLQYNVEAGRWTQIGTLQRRRFEHAITEANLGAVCRPIGLGDSNAATTTNGLDPLLICLILVCCRGCNKSCTHQGDNKQSL